MSHARDLQLRKFSKGMLQRVGIAQALINDPELIVLDEPMSGLDPIGRKEVRDLILHLKESGKTVMFSSHILHDAEMLCDRVAMIMKGKLVACGPVSELIAQGTTHEVEMVIDRLLPEALDRLRPLAGKVVLQGERVMVVLTSQQAVDQALSVIYAAKAKLVALTPHKASLEDLFIREANVIQSAKEAPVS
jgi:ABC-2 type transport system ATP-binding protein